VFPALYIALKFTIKSPWIKYDMMDFSEMEDIRIWRENGESTMMSGRPAWKRSIGKFTDE
jgi:amino acid transporter